MGCVSNSRSFKIPTDERWASETEQDMGEGDRRSERPYLMSMIALLIVTAEFSRILVIRSGICLYI